MSSTDPQDPATPAPDPWRKPETGSTSGAAPAPAPVPDAVQPYASGPAYPSGEAYPSSPAYPSGEAYPSSPAYPSGEAYPPAPTYGAPVQHPVPGGYPPAQAYGYPAYRGYLPKNSYAVWSLVLGILGLVSCGFFTGIPAIVVGNNAKKAAANGEADNPGMATAGVVLGWIGTGWSGLVVVGYLVFVVVMLLTTASA
ncbi:DUF4190 domain-containing protein [Cellulomonas sp. H30R-01]|uniref:DUF4190 domain-containing protein n=1 Tax=Cellulomonas sp. H30R-01 TaxID=2704467 RepID=UPI00138D7CD4|nr:DUF4190 domain-containing protein [Cellulomonas sp. H30R-01]QHT55659.1 DUF4190 domain-containing protein [Cellulomonas sp. H30R-01]